MSIWPVNIGPPRGMGEVYHDPFQAEYDRMREFEGAEASGVESPGLATTGPGRLDVVGDLEWPEPIHEPALEGVAGELVKYIEPTTEADPAAILLQFLVGFGSLVGKGAFVEVDGHKHHPNLFAVIVGDTSRARKGTSWRRVRQALAFCDPRWEAERILGGLSSGEGVIWAVRDPIMGIDKKNGGQTIVDHGVSDKRLLVVENEFGGALRVLGREGSTLSSILRQAYDGDDLRFLTKNNPAASTAPHVSLCGHVTREELRKHLSSVEAFNGLGNRILWTCARRSKKLPFGGAADARAIERLGAILGGLAVDAREAGGLTWAPSGARVWEAAYDLLTEPDSGLLGAITSRAEAHSLRLAMIYALLEGRREIVDADVEAALSVWDYCDDSAEFLFGGLTIETKRDAQADQVLATLRLHPGGLSRSTISTNALSGHISSDDLTRLLDLLVESGQARRETVATGGRPSERYYAL